MKAFNMNNYVYVELTDRGREIYFHKDDELRARGYFPYKPEMPKEENGYLKLQMHEFIDIFGRDIGMVKELPCETTIYFDDKDIT